MFFLEKHINELAVQMAPSFITNCGDRDLDSLYEMPGVSTARENFGIEACAGLSHDVVDIDDLPV